MILLLGGTSDSIKIAKFLKNSSINFFISVATKEGLEISKDFLSNLIIGKKNLNELSEFCKSHSITSIIDATHPHAKIISENAINISNKENINYIRYERKSTEKIEHKNIFFAKNANYAAIKASQIAKKVFLSTGMNTLDEFTREINPINLFVRVLPTITAIKKCESLNIPFSNIIAIKGPFSKLMNIETFKHFDIDLLITKESGLEGGFDEKIQAAMELNIPVLIITRPILDYPNKFEDLSTLFDKIKLLR